MLTDQNEEMIKCTQRNLSECLVCKDLRNKARDKVTYSSQQCTDEERNPTKLLYSLQQPIISNIHVFNISMMIMYTHMLTHSHTHVLSN